MEPSLPIKDIIQLPPVDRQRPPRAKRLNRERLVSLAVTVGAVVLIGTLLWAGTAFVMTDPVPRVVGVEKAVAATRVSQAGFVPDIVEVRFSSEPAGAVLEQEPRGGSRARPGARISLVVSGGVDQSVMPDLSGETVAYAQLFLRQLGVSAMILNVQSDEPPGRVISTKPEAGTPVTAGDTVTLRVAASSGRGDVVQANLSSVTVVLDPRYAPDSSPDVAYEISLRTRSLLEAAGARVVVTRGAAERGLSPGALTSRAAAASPDAYVLLAFRDGGDGGAIVSGPTDDTKSGGQTLASLTYDGIRMLGATASIGSRTRALRDIADESVSVNLGSSSSSLDAQHYADAEWRESVARAVYLAIGQRLGR